MSIPVHWKCEIHGHLGMFGWLEKRFLLSVDWETGPCTKLSNDHYLQLLPIIPLKYCINYRCFYSVISTLRCTYQLIFILLDPLPSLVSLMLHVCHATDLGSDLAKISTSGSANFQVLGVIFNQLYHLHSETITVG